MPEAAGVRHQQMCRGEPEYKVIELIPTGPGMKPDGNLVFNGVVQGQEVLYRTDPMSSDKVTTVLAQFGERM